MSYFAIPFRPLSAPASSIASPSLVKTSRKLKRKRIDSSASSNTTLSASSSADSDFDENNINNNITQKPLNVLTNPLNLSEAEIVQYNLAGLDLCEALPSISEWPHRGIPAQKKNPIWSKKDEKRGKNARDERNIDKDQERNKNSNYHKKQVVGEEENRGFIKGHQLRLQHINVLTTILHKCLLAHDVLRASRAWGLLIRMQVSGQGMDLRASGYWSIGAELLIRSLCSKHSGATFNSETETDDGGISSRIRNKSHHPESSRSGWDLIKNLQKTTDYYERLIIEYPFKKQFLSKINALDWWPVMISCEIYGIQHEQKKAIHDLQINTTLEKELSSQDISCDESDREDEIDYEANIFDNDIKSNNERLVKRKQFRKQEHRWQLENKIRLTALNASEKIALRLDERMTTPPYSESLDLLHLRGMLALYIGDLHLPPLPPKYQMEELGKKNDDQFPKSRNIGNGSISQGRLLFRERNIEFQNGLARRSQEINNAKTFFEKLVKLGGDEAAIINLGGENLRIDDEFLPSDILSDD